MKILKKRPVFNIKLISVDLLSFLILLEVQQINYIFQRLQVCGRAQEGVLKGENENLWCIYTVTLSYMDGYMLAFTYMNYCVQTHIRDAVVN